MFYVTNEVPLKSLQWTHRHFGLMFRAKSKLKIKPKCVYIRYTPTRGTVVFMRFEAFHIKKLYAIPCIILILQLNKELLGNQVEH